MGRREEQRAQTRKALQEAALSLFLKNGYEATTVTQIAEAAGVSHMTFFRNFPSKEDVALRDEYDPVLEELIRAQDVADPAIERVRIGVGIVVKKVCSNQADREEFFQRARLVLTVPSLRTRIWESLAASTKAFERGLTPPGEEDESSLRVRVVAASCSSVLSTAVTAWVEGGGVASLPQLVDEAFDALRDGFTPLQSCERTLGSDRSNHLSSGSQS